MKTSEFIARYGILCRARHIEDYTVTDATGPHPRRRFGLTFHFRDHDGTWRAETFDYDTGRDVTTSSLDRAEALCHIAMDAFYGDSYENLLDQFGTECGVTRERWQAVHHDTRLRSRAWITDPEMWEDFLSLEYDETTPPPRPRTSLGGVPLTKDDIDDYIYRIEADEDHALEPEAALAALRTAHVPDEDTRDAARAALLSAARHAERTGRIAADTFQPDRPHEDRTRPVRRSYHVLTDDWAEHYTYDPENPPLWDGPCCAFYSVLPDCPDTDTDLVPFLDPDDAEHLIQAHRQCLDTQYGPGKWTRAEIPYDEDEGDHTDD